MKAIIISLLATAFVCGCSCKAGFAQSKDNPFGDTNTKVVELKVTGVTCQGCADHVTGALSKKEGVVKSDVKFAENSASITYDPGSVIEAEIIRTIEETGYKAEVKGEKSNKEIKKEDSTPQARRVPKKKT